MLVQVVFVVLPRSESDGWAEGTSSCLMEGTLLAIVEFQDVRGGELHATCRTKNLFAAHNHTNMLSPVVRKQIQVALIFSFTDGTVVVERASGIIPLIHLTFALAMLGENFRQFTLKGLALITDKCSAVVCLSQLVTVAVVPVFLGIPEEKSPGAMFTLVWQGEISGTILRKVKEGFPLFGIQFF